MNTTFVVPVPEDLDPTDVIMAAAQALHETYIDLGDIIEGPAKIDFMDRVYVYEFIDAETFKLDNVVCKAEPK
jgi:hypothetical protein